MRKKIKAKVSAPQKQRAATYISKDMWDWIKLEAEKSMTSESHIMRILLDEAIKARSS